MLQSSPECVIAKSISKSEFGLDLVFNEISSLNELFWF